MRVMICGVAALALAACQPAVPDSAAQVGFDNVDRRAARDAELEGRSDVTTVRPPAEVQASALDEAGTAEALAAERAAAANSGVAPLQASPQNPAPQAVTNAAGISRENSFDAVSNERSIEGDAAMIAQNRAQYTLIAPTDLPTRPGSDRPNIVEYALRTSNPVGAPLYRRSSFTTENKYLRACASYPSSDLAQEDFLARGGPQRDRLGVDPDGDGFACDWDPAPFRAVRGG
ncbi:hypothetical protein [Aestuariicoccus sp. MJ-SS9]|uniref:hypothetical protein n=1 Tax=Aestuariicoccus sp. MJ-SS9 TaxID=3079855 RepID=UPI002906332A|nr:hypothetical protein [Aestuariicoccus sp. MJ-SS9]MDU8913252.1 hypothetical protein [Aestuariicoccus sp. MJ-SS9]